MLQGDLDGIEEVDENEVRHVAVSLAAAKPFVTCPEMGSFIHVNPIKNGHAIELGDGCRDGANVLSSRTYGAGASAAKSTNVSASRTRDAQCVSKSLGFLGVSVKLPDDFKLSKVPKKLRELHTVVIFLPPIECDMPRFLQPCGRVLMYGSVSAFCDRFDPNASYMYSESSLCGREDRLALHCCHLWACMGSC